MKTLPLFASGLAVLLTANLASLRAQWASQSLPLHGGWNAVHLDVQPEPPDCDAVFADLPVESVWAWNRRFTPVEFIQDPATLVPQQPDWLLYLPASHRLEEARTLFTVEAGKSYLIKLPDNAAPVTWTLKGLARPRTPDWVASSFNFVGFPVPTSSPPRLIDFLYLASVLTNVQRLSAEGFWTRVDNAGSTATLRQGEALWVFAAKATDYAGPIRVTLEQSTGLHYARLLQEQTVRIRNDSRVPRTVTVSLLNSEAAPAGQTPVAGAVVLDYWDNNLSYTSGGWKPFNAPITSPSLPAGAEWTLRLAVKRSAMPLAGLYQSVLEVRDNPASL